MSEDQIYRDALERIIKLCKAPPSDRNDSVILGQIMEVAQSVLTGTAPLTFSVGDRVRHVGRDELGTVTLADTMFVQVKYDRPTPKGSPSVGLYDRVWFRQYPNLLVAASQ